MFYFPTSSAVNIAHSNLQNEFSQCAASQQKPFPFNWVVRLVVVFFLGQRLCNRANTMMAFQMSSLPHCCFSIWEYRISFYLDNWVSAAINIGCKVSSLQRWSIAKLNCPAAYKGAWCVHRPQLHCKSNSLQRRTRDFTGITCDVHLSVASQQREWKMRAARLLYYASFISVPHRWCTESAKIFSAFVLN